MRAKNLSVPDFRSDSIFSGPEGALRFKVAVRGLFQYVIDHSGTIASGATNMTEGNQPWRKANCEMRFCRDRRAEKRDALAEFQKFSVRFANSFRKQYGHPLGKTEGLNSIKEKVSAEKRAARSSLRCVQRKRFYRARS